MNVSRWAELDIPAFLRERGVSRVCAFATPMQLRFRGITVREGLLLRGPEGWGECSPFWDYAPPVAARWLRAGLACATSVLPDPLAGRDFVATNVTVPILGPAAARERVLAAGCGTAKVKVAGAGTSLAADCDRIAAVREALEELRQRGVIAGPGRIRVDANAAWDVPAAAEAINAYARAAGVHGLEYVEQPCPDLADLARLRRLVAVPLAADEAIRLAADPLRLDLRGVADVAVLKLQPLGGPRALLRVAEHLQLPVVVSSALDSSVGIFAALRTAAALPQLAGACGLGTVNLLAADPAAPSLVPSAGGFPGTVFTGPRACAAFTGFVQDPADTQWAARWQSRLKAMVEQL